MDEEVHKKELEAIKNAAERHSTQMQQAWEQAGANAAMESVRLANLEKKAKRAKSKSGQVTKTES
jgi:hypothetical protein